MTNIEPLLQRFRQLDSDEKLALLAQLWDEIAADPEALPVTEEEKRLLDERLQQHAEHPEDVVDWELVRAEGEALLKARRG